MNTLVISCEKIQPTGSGPVLNPDEAEKMQENGQNLEIDEIAGGCFRWSAGGLFSWCFAVFMVGLGKNGGPGKGCREVHCCRLSCFENNTIKNLQES